MYALRTTGYPKDVENRDPAPTWNELFFFVPQPLLDRLLKALRAIPGGLEMLEAPGATVDTDQLTRIRDAFKDEIQEELDRVNSQLAAEGKSQFTYVQVGLVDTEPLWDDENSTNIVEVTYRERTRWITTIWGFAL